MLRAEIVCIGDELLLGQVIDTNSAWMGKELAKIGIEVSQKTIISDKKEAIVSALDASLQRSDLVLLTGGLGPTKDDITKNVLASYFKSDWRTDEDVLAHLRKIFEARGRELMETNKLQAQLPEKCKTLFNEVGTAPGMLFETNGKIVISMPGVPSEMEYLMLNRVIPYLLENCELPTIKYRTLICIGIPESLLSKKLEQFEAKLPEGYGLAYLPAYNSIRLRLSARGNNENAELLKFDTLFEELRTECGEHFFAESEADPINVLAQKLIKENISISFAESCTGGLLASKLVSEPGVSAIFNGSIISYANEIKINKLGVSREIIETVGAVSEECAKAMANGVANMFDSQLAISTTGIAGPDGGTKEKPVGLVFIGVHYKGQTVVKKYHMPGTRDRFRQVVGAAAAKLAMDILRR